MGQAGEDRDNISKILKEERTFNQEHYIQQGCSSEIKDDKDFPKQTKAKKFNTTAPDLKQMLKKVLLVEMKG